MTWENKWIHIFKKLLRHCTLHNKSKNKKLIEMRLSLCLKFGDYFIKITFNLYQTPRLEGQKRNIFVFHSFRILTTPFNIYYQVCGRVVRLLLPLKLVYLFQRWIKGVHQRSGTMTWSLITMLDQMERRESRLIIATQSSATPATTCRQGWWW